MHMALLINIIFYVILLLRSDTGYAEDDFRQDPKVTRQFKMRCTRRYSPGVCANRVSPVWTFAIHKQNCSERLGCANYFRSNRFKSYSICMRQCQGLIDMYLQMLEVDTNKTRSGVLLRKGERVTPKAYFSTIVGLRPDSDVLSPEELEELGNEDYEVGENETHSIVYKDLLDNEDIFPPDVDRVDGEIRSQYDLLHP